MGYRNSRNIEASLIDFLTTELEANWSNISVEKTFARIKDISLPSVCIRVGDTTHAKAELGGDSTIRTVQVFIDVFATSDGQRLDIKDFIVEKIKGGCIYYDYIISGGSVQSKTANGRIRVTSIEDTGVNFDIDREKLSVWDRYRHLITLSVSLGRVEA